MTCDKHWTEGARITDACYSCDVRAEMETRDLSVAGALRHEELADPEVEAITLLWRAAKHVIGHLDGWFDVAEREEALPFVVLYRDEREVFAFDCADSMDDHLYRDRYKVAARRVSESR